MKVVVFMANGFEVLETFSPIDVLKRCGAEVTTVSINDDLFVESSQKDIFKANKLLNDIDYKDFDLIILPGGYPGYVNLRENKKIVEILKFFLENNKKVAAICGAPTIFPYNRLAIGRNLTAHSSTKEQFLENYNYIEEAVVVDKNIITAVGAGHSLDFAFKIAEQFFSKEKIDEVKKGMELI